MTPEPFVTADDIAEHLKVTRRQVLEMARKGLIPAYPLGTGEHRRVWRYKISEVDAAMAASTRKSLGSQKHDDLARLSEIAAGVSSTEKSGLASRERASMVRPKAVPGAFGTEG